MYAHITNILNSDQTEITKYMDRSKLFRLTCFHMKVIVSKYTKSENSERDYWI